MEANLIKAILLEKELHLGMYQKKSKFNKSHKNKYLQSLKKQIYLRENNARV